jgi:hypothetical protein
MIYNVPKLLKKIHGCREKATGASTEATVGSTVYAVT